MDISNKLNKIVEEFIEKNVLSNIKEEFKLAAIHFNINLNVCSKYDLMRIDHKVKEVIMANENTILTTSAIYNYILYREIKNNKIEETERETVKISMFNISNTITEYFTYKISEQELNSKLKVYMKTLGI